MTQNDRAKTWTRAVRDGDTSALAKLLAMYHPQLRARAEARMDATLKAKTGPEDILQEVYLQVFRQIDRFQEHGPGSFLKWVYTILDHKLIDARRAAHRQVRDLDRETPLVTGASTDSYWNLLDHVYADSGTPSRVVRRQEALSGLLACLSDLSDAHREVIQLRFLDGLSVSEAASRMDKSEAAVVALTRRALDALRQNMDRQGEFTHGD